MIAPDRKHVRRLRAAIRTQIKAHPELRRQRRTAKRRWTQDIRFEHLRFVVPLLVAGGVIAAPRAVDALPALAWWTLGMTLLLAGRLGTDFRTAPALGIFYHWPVSNEEVFRHQAWRLMRSAAWLGFDWLAFGVVAAARQGGISAWLAAPAFAAAQAIVATSVALLLVRWKPRFPFGALGGMVVWCTWIVLQLSSHTTAGPGVIRPLLHTLMLATPGGWLEWAHASALSGAALGWIGITVLAGAGVFWIRHRVVIMSRTFSLENALGYEEAADAPGAASPPAEFGPEQEPAAAQEATRRIEATAEPETPEVAVDLAALRTRLDDALTEPPGLALFTRGSLERRATRLLTLRQRVLVDFLQPRGARWDRNWLTALALIVLVAALRSSGSNADALAWLPVIALVFFALPVFGGSWLGFTPLVTPGGQSGLYAFVPIGYFELFGTVLTVNVLRCVAGFPLILLAARYGFSPTPLPWDDALAVAWRIAAVALAVMPVWTLLVLSKTTNDSSARWWLTVLAVMTVLAALAASFLLGIALFVSENLGIQLACLSGILGLIYSIVALYGWLWGRGSFDLIGKLPR